MESIEVLDFNNLDKWHHYLLQLPLSQQDIFFSPEYYSFCESLGHGKANCFVLQNGKDIVMYPFLKNSVNKLGFDLSEQYFDVQGVYGYNGVITNSNSVEFIKGFFACFDEYCNKNNIIAEFLRINPILPNFLLFRNNFQIIHDRNNVNVNLLNNNIFDNEYEYSTRKNVRKAISNGLNFASFFGNEISESELESFSMIYNHTMKRNNAEEFYYFDIDYFKDLSYYLGKKALFVFVLLDNNYISCELVLLGSITAYSFLGGTLSEYFNFRPNDFLKHNTICLLKNLGFHNFILGGGDEGIFRYKKSFSKKGVIPFYIGKKIHNQVIYNGVVRQWEMEKYSQKEKYANILLKYRYSN